MPRDIPVIFSGPMVRALLDGRKTMTRRLAWAPRKEIKKRSGVFGCPASPWQNVKDGDRLWVRESWKPHSTFSNMKPRDMPKSHVFYMADGRYEPSGVKGFPSIFMPRWASRLTLIVTGTKIERLQDISEKDATAEGWKAVPSVSDDPEVHRDAARDWFSDLWESLHGVQSWRDNPEVVALSFRMIRANIDAPEARAA